MAIYDINGNIIDTGTSFYTTTDDSINVLNLSTTSPSSQDPEGWDSDSFAICDYIAVEPAAGCTIVTNDQYRPWGSHIYTYNSSKVFIEKVSVSGIVESSGMRLFPFIPDQDVAYIRFQYATHTVTTSTILRVYPKEVWTSDELPTYSFTGDAKRIRELLNIPNINSSLENASVIALGDSITENNTHNNNKAWCEYLSDVFGMKVYNNGKSGTGLIKGYQGYSSICNRVDLGANNYPTITPDMVLIMANGNDATSGSFYDYSGNSTTVTNEYGEHSLPVGTNADTSSTISVYGAMKHLFESLITKYPTAKIGFITSTPRLQDLTSLWGADKANFYGHGAFHDYVEAIKWVCDEYNVPCLDLYHSTILRPWNQANAQAFYADQSIHPNTLGTIEGIVKPVCRWVWDNFT